jgi:hypothetical protein
MEIKNPYTNPAFAKAFVAGYEDAKAGKPDTADVRRDYRWGSKARAYDLGRMHGEEERVAAK